MQINDVFRDWKRGWGWKKAPQGSFWRIFLLYKQNYVSSVGPVFDMLNNLHIWVFVKWELKELKLRVKESQVPGIWKKKSESKNRCRFWLFQKNLTELSGFTKTRKRGTRQVFGRLFYFYKAIENRDFV